MMKSRKVIIDYTNHRGLRMTRIIVPTGGMFFGSNEWHTEMQWLLPAKGEGFDGTRAFAMKDIHSWKPEDA